MGEFLDIAFPQRQRLHFLEVLALWHGEVNRAHICDSFGVKGAQVSRDITVYRDRCPKNLVYDNRRRVYTPSDQFVPFIANGEPLEHLALLRAGLNPKTIAVSPSMGLGLAPLGQLPQPTFAISPDVVRGLLLAINGHHPVEIVYRSMSSGEGKRVIWPHSLLLTGAWWYVRGFDHARSDYRDFALHRFQSVARTKTKLPHPTATDLDWDNEIDVEIAPSPKLDSEQQAIVALDYNMRSTESGWRWSARMRRALVGYFAIEHRLDLIDTPQPGRLVCINRGEVEGLLFRADTLAS